MVENVSQTDEKKEAQPEAAEAVEKDEETISELDRADQIAERQKRENDRREKLLEREEALEARRAIGGRTEAGGEIKKPEISDKEYAEKAIAGELKFEKTLKGGN